MNRDACTAPFGIAKPWLAVAVLALGAACSSPRSATPMPEPLALDPGKIGGPMIVLKPPFLASLSAQAGAAPAGASVRLTNLDDAGPALTTVARGDGSFDFDLGELVETGDELRLQAVLDGRRGPPLDLSTELGLVPSSRHDCVVLRPGYELELELGSSELQLENRCDSGLMIALPRTRLGLEVALTPALPVEISVGDAASFEVLLTDWGATDLPVEEILFVDVSVDGRALRYPITLFSPGQP